HYQTDRFVEYRPNVRAQSFSFRIHSQILHNGIDLPRGEIPPVAVIDFVVDFEKIDIPFRFVVKRRTMENIAVINRPDDPRLFRTIYADNDEPIAAAIIVFVRLSQVGNHNPNADVASYIFDILLQIAVKMLDPDVRIALSHRLPEPLQKLAVLRSAVSENLASEPFKSVRKRKLFKPIAGGKMFRYRRFSRPHFSRQRDFNHRAINSLPYFLTSSWSGERSRRLY